MSFDSKYISTSSQVGLLKVRASDPTGPQPIIGLSTGHSLLRGLFPSGSMAAPMP